MKNKKLLWAAALLLAGCLYFFENNTGTRILLVCAGLLPFIPPLRRALFGRDAVRTQTRNLSQTVGTFALRATEEPGEVRPYRDGDPASRIHWKLSVKTDRLLVREDGREMNMENAQREAAVQAPAPAGLGRRKGLLLSSLAVVLLLLFLLPFFRDSLQALMDRVFAASEQVNRYTYRYFGAVASPWPAGILLGLLAAVWIGFALLYRSRWAALALFALCALLQVYFGLALPDGLNVLLFFLLACFLLRSPREPATLLKTAALFLAAGLCVLLLLPGTDGPTEAASEWVRDRFSALSAAVSGGGTEAPAGETETRHVRTLSLEEGENASGGEKEYRLETVEEEQISAPRWISWMRILLLSLAGLALLVLPFLPFVVLNRQRERDRREREAFRTGEAAPAVRGILQRTVRWLEATGNGAGNLPYAQWGSTLAEKLDGEYARRFERGAALFEEALYSHHALTEEQRQEALALLRETETRLWTGADRRTRWRLKYGECLWIEESKNWG